MKENLQCTSKYGHLRISQDIYHVRMTDIEGFLTIYGHSDNLLNNKYIYIYIFFIFYFFTSKPVTRTTKQVLPKLVAYLNNRVLLLMALPCDRLPEEI